MAEVIPILPARRMRLTTFTREQAMKEWPLLSQLLSLADSHVCGRYDVGDLKIDVERGAVAIVVAWIPEAGTLYAVFAIQEDTYPNKRVFHIIHCGGVEMQEWIHLYPALRQLAKDAGFDQIQITGRKGWGRVLQNFVQEKGRIFIEELT